MAFDGNGNFIRLHSWTQDAANDLNINARDMDAEDNGFAGGLSNAVTRDGQGKMAVPFLLVSLLQLCGYAAPVARYVPVPCPLYPEPKVSLPQPGELSQDLEQALEGVSPTLTSAPPSKP